MPRKSCTLRPWHTKHHPEPVCSVTFVAHAANLIARRVRSTTSARGCGSYLFVSPDGMAYVVSEDAAVGQSWVRERFAWLVGLYRMGGRDNSMDPTVEGLAEDITEHMGSATTGREYGGRQQTGAANSLQSAPDVGSSSRPEAGLAVDGDNSASGGGRYE